MHNIKHEEYLDLIEKCKSGCRNSQERLHSIIKNPVYSICRKYSGDDMEAEDIAQECFVRVFTKLEDYRGEGPFQGWVRRIAVNLSINEYRRRRKLGITDDIDSKWDIQDDSFGKMDPEYTKEEMDEFVEALPRGYKEIFKLYFIDGYKHKEIAEMLGISINTSKTQLLRGRLAIKRSMEEKGYRFN